MSILGDIGDPQKDAAALAPVVDKAVADLIAGAAQQITPAIEKAIVDGLASLQVTVTVNVNRKQP